MIEVILNDRLGTWSDRVVVLGLTSRHPGCVCKARSSQRLPRPLPMPGKKIRVKCNEDDTIGDLKKLVAAQTGGWRSQV